MSIKVGTTCILNKAMLGNNAGAKGVCYEVGHVGDRPSYGFIFENGDYDGFSPDEVEMFLDLGDTVKLKYEFRNVIKLSDDFKMGVFNIALERNEVTGEKYHSADASTS